MFDKRIHSGPGAARTTFSPWGRQSRDEIEELVDAVEAATPSLEAVLAVEDPYEAKRDQPIDIVA